MTARAAAPRDPMRPAWLAAVRPRPATAWVMRLAPTGLHAPDQPPPPGDGLDVDDTAAWQRQAAATLGRLAPHGLAGRAVRLVVDDRLTLPGVMTGRLWRLRDDALQAAARDWFDPQGGASDWRVRAVLQPDGRHALVGAMREGVLQAVADAVELAGGRLAGAVPRWALALAGAEAATAHGPALVAAPRAGADHLAVALRDGGNWRRVELEPVDDGRDDAWALAAESLHLRDEAAGAAAVGAVGDGSEADGRTAARPLRRVAACDAPVAAPPPGTDWSAVAAWPADGPAAGPWSAAALDFAPVDGGARRSPAAIGAMAAGVVLLLAVAMGLHGDWRRLDADRRAAEAAAALARTAPPATARPPLPADMVAALRAELAHPWLAVLDRLAADRPEDIVLQRVEPSREPTAAGARLRVTLAGQAPTPAALLAWKRRLDADAGLRDVRLIGWEREGEGDGGRIGFRLEVSGGVDG